MYNVNPVKNFYKKLKRGLAASVIALVVLSCGTETALVTSGISGTGIVLGVITGFGSIFVNGVKYEIDNANFNVDGNLSANQTNLKIGMVVRLDTTSFDDGTFEANNVVYDDSIEGPILTAPTPVPGDADLREFDVMGVNVQISATSTTFDGVSFETLALHDIIEVSGFLDANGKILATLIEKKGGLPAGGSSEVEIRGTVSNHVDLVSFSLNGLTVSINYSNSTELDDLPTGVDDGLVVEVKGIYNSTTNTITADEIEGEDDDRDELVNSESSLSLQGFMTGFVDVDSQFTINGIPVLIDTTKVPQTILSQLIDGLQVEVHGLLSGGVLMADEVEIREGKSKYQAVVKSLDLAAQTFTIGYPNISGEILLKLDTQSRLEDENGDPITLAEINDNDEVKVVARVIDDEKIIVSLKRDTDFDMSYEISGVVEATVAGISFTIDGLLFPLNSGGVIYEPIGLPGSIVLNQTEVELEDDDRDGDIDEVELK